MKRLQMVALGVVLLLVLAVIPTGASLAEIIDDVGPFRLLWAILPLALLPIVFVLLLPLVEGPRETPQHRHQAP